MSDTRADRLLRDWDTVASAAIRPAAAPRPAAIGRRAGAGPGLLPLVAGALMVALVIAWLGGHEDLGVGDGSASGSPNGSLLLPSTSPRASEPAAPSSGRASAAAPARCDVARLVVEIAAWDGSPGSRTAALTLRLKGRDACSVDRLWRPELIDGSGRVRIAGEPVGDRATIELRPGETVTTFAQASNDCAPPPVPPVSIAFVLSDGSRVIANPPTPDDITTAPCNGAGQPGVISMQPWTR